MKKSILLVAVLIALVSLCLVFASCDSDSSDSASTVAVEGVSLDPAELTLKTGTYGTLTATVLPENATDKSVTWSSSDETVATVDNNGKVTGVAAGTATITVKTNDGAKIATCVVTVSANTHTVSFKANGGSGTMNSGSVVEGETYTIPANGFTAPAFTAKTGAVPATHKNFVGWNTAADGSGKSYEAKGTIPATDITANITLYAQWTKPSFSVNGEGKKVYFSKGNLQAVFAEAGTVKTWKFAEHQYDYVGNSVANTKIDGNGTVSAAGTVDLFGWSTDATDYGINNSTTPTDYSGGFKNWGKNAISNGGDTANTWSTLSKDEWSYLLNGRTVNEGQKEGKSYQRATINSDATGGGVYGMIIYPDNYTAQTAATSYTSAEWSVMENAGVVFLPAAGYREVSSVNYSGDYGDYWSATPRGSDYACSLYFGSSFVVPARLDYRDLGLSVRLVCGEN